jgi:hypothetical protein
VTATATEQIFARFLASGFDVIVDKNASTGLSGTPAAISDQ